MTNSGILFLVILIGASVGFLVLLTWAEHRTRQGN